MPSNRRSILTIAGAIVAAAAIVAVAIVLSSGDDKQSASPPSPTPSPTTSAPTTPTTTAAATSSAATSTAASPSATATVSTLPGGAVLGQSCSSPQYGYELSYPDGWHAELAFPGWQCALFDPKPFKVTADSEVPQVAVIVSVAEFSFNSSVAQYTDPAANQLVSKNDLTIDGQAAAAVEVVTIGGNTPFPAGTMRYAVLIDLGQKTFVIETNDVAASDYAIDKHVVLGMAGSFTRKQ